MVAVVHLLLLSRIVKLRQVDFDGKLMGSEKVWTVRQVMRIIPIFPIVHQKRFQSG